MDINVTVKKQHLYIFSLLVVLALGAVLVNAFGTSSPSTFGHSPNELIVNNESVFPDTLGGNEVNESDLSCTAITGGAGLCDGSDATADGDTSSSNELQSLGTSGSTITLSGGGGSVTAPFATTSGGVSCTNCLDSSEIDEDDIRQPCNWGTGDYCFDVSARVICSSFSCSGGSCSGCSPKIADDMVLTCVSGRMVQFAAVASSVC